MPQWRLKSPSNNKTVSQPADLAGFLRLAPALNLTARSGKCDEFAEALVVVPNAGGERLPQGQKQRGREVGLFRTELVELWRRNF